MYDIKYFEDFTKKAYPLIDDKGAHTYAEVLYAGYKIAKLEEKADTKISKINKRYDTIKKIVTFLIAFIMEVVVGTFSFFIGIKIGAPEWGAFILGFCSVFCLFGDNPLYKNCGKSMTKENNKDEKHD
jgi:hypothetical protein